MDHSEGIFTRLGHRGIPATKTRLGSENEAVAPMTKSLHALLPFLRSAAALQPHFQFRDPTWPVAHYEWPVLLVPFLSLSLSLITSTPPPPLSLALFLSLSSLPSPLPSLSLSICLSRFVLTDTGCDGSGAEWCPGPCRHGYHCPPAAPCRVRGQRAGCTTLWGSGGQGRLCLAYTPHLRLVDRQQFSSPPPPPPPPPCLTSRHSTAWAGPWPCHCWTLTLSLHDFDLVTAGTWPCHCMTVTIAHTLCLTLWCMHDWPWRSDFVLSSMDDLEHHPPPTPISTPFLLLLLCFWSKLLVWHYYYEWLSSLSAYSYNQVANVSGYRLSTGWLIIFIPLHPVLLWLIEFVTTIMYLVLCFCAVCQVHMVWIFYVGARYLNGPVCLV